MSIAHSHAHPQPSMPKCLPGFESINRYWDKNEHVYTAKILPGEYYVTKHNERIVTVLGSCVSACIRDRVLGVGGMNHFMLPASAVTAEWNEQEMGLITRYGNVAMEHLINEILKSGGQRKNLEVKLFGGGKVLANMTNVGAKNIEFVRAFVHMEKLKMISADLGDIYPRKVVYCPSNGKAFVKKLRSMHNNTITERERKYMQEIDQQPVAGEIDLF